MPSPSMPDPVPTPLDRPAVARLYLQAQPMVQAFVHGLVRPASDADDLCQDIGVKILGMDAIAVAPETFPAWCRGVARNEILHHWRRQRRQPTHSDERLLDLADRAWSESEGDAEVHRAQAERLRRMRLCVAALAERQRTVLERFYHQGESAAAIGAALGRTAEAVLMALVRIRRRLRSCIAESSR